MSLLATVADVHLASHRSLGGQWRGGINDRARMISLSMQRATETAASLGCADFVVAGDLFDVEDPEAQIVDEAARALRSSMRLHFLRGNHDMRSSDARDSAMAVLDNLPHSFYYEAPRLVECGDWDVWMVPFQPGPSKVWLPEVMQVLAGETRRARPRVLITHLGIHDASMRTMPWIEAADDAIGLELLGELGAQHGIDLVIAGNWHFHKAWTLPQTTVIQVGALVPTGWDNPGAYGYGSLIVVDSLKPRMFQRFEVPGPRFLAAKSIPELDDLALEVIPECAVFGLISVPEEAYQVACAQAAELPFHAIDVRIDAGAARHQARAASEAARSSPTMREAVARYVDRVDLEEAIRPAVLAKTLTYLGLS